jgi:hypothetical protein
MAGTRKGALKAVRTKKARYGKNIFRITGRRGGNPMLLRKIAR